MQLLHASILLTVLIGQPWHEAKQALRDLERVESVATEHRWQGATGSWQLGNNWDTGEIPSVHDSTDNALFSALSQQSVDSGLDLSAAFFLRRIVTQPDYRGNIGMSGSPLITHTASAGDELSRVIHRGSGEFHFFGVLGSLSDVLVDTAAGKFFGDGQINNLFVKNGPCHIASTCALTNYVVVDGPGAHLTIDAPNVGELAGKYLLVNGGVCENKRAIDSAGFIVVMGGRLIQTGALPDNIVIVVGPAGRFVYTPNITLTAAHDNVDLANFGSLDISQSHQDVGFDTYITGNGAGVEGTPVQSGVPSVLSTRIDLREQYP